MNLFVIILKIRILIGQKFMKNSEQKYWKVLLFFYTNIVSFNYWQTCDLVFKLSTNGFILNIKYRYSKTENDGEKVH